MKTNLRILAVTAVIVILSAFSFPVRGEEAPPRLACEEVFSRKDLNRKGRNLVTVNGADNYFRSVTAKSDPEFAREIRALVERDRKRADNVVEGTSESGNEYIILNVLNNDSFINIGFTYAPDTGACTLFIQSHPKAFK